MAKRHQEPGRVAAYHPEALRATVVALARDDGRLVGTAGHERARGDLVARLSATGLEPYASPAATGSGFELPYRAGGTDFTNLAAVAPGRDRALAPVLIGAHYDTAGPFAGADDNAAAVAIALAVAERLRAAPASRDVILALFDAEEPPWFHTPAMGSTWFRAHQQAGPVHAALVMDLVGHAVPIPGAENVLFVTGMESDPDLEETIRHRLRLEGLSVVTALNRYVGDMSDHHAYRLGRTPYLFLTCGRWSHYHRPSDKPDKLDYRKMTAVAAFLEHCARDVAARDLAGPWEGYDTTATDLATTREGLAAAVAALGLRLDTRSDIERFADALMQRFRV